MITPFQIHQFQHYERRKRISLSNINKLHEKIEGSFRSAGGSRPNNSKMKAKTQNSEDDHE